MKKPLIEELVIARLNGSMAVLIYEIEGNYAPFPKNLKVEMVDLFGLPSYHLFCIDNYTIVYNDKTVLKLEREYGWYIQSIVDAPLEPNEFYLNDAALSIKLPSNFTLGKQNSFAGVLSGVTKFNIKSDTSCVEPTVYYGRIMDNDNDCHYCIINYVDDYYTDELAFKSIRRWRLNST